MSLRNRLARWSGLLSTGVRRTLSRATDTNQQRIQFTVLGVAATIALLVVVTGIGVGLATSTTVYDDDVDYWIIPDTDGDRSLLVATDQPQFGSVHDTNDRIRDHDDVTFSSPILAEVLRAEHGDHTEFVLVVGVINSDGLDQVAGVSTAGLTNDDPYYDGGTAGGERTGEVVLSQSAANVLESQPGDRITISNAEFTVEQTAAGETAGADIPIALVQLSELQELTGADGYDQADQFVVGATTPGVQSELEGVYPESNVLTRGEMTATSVVDSDISLALSLAAFVVALVIGTLFVLTTAGLEIVADRTQLATMSAIGITTRSQLVLTGVQTILLTGIGGLVGSIGGLGLIWLTNAVAMETLTTEPIAVAHPLFVAYGVGVALLMGVLSMPYLLVLTRRVTGGVPS
ncbi:ABC transporter permease [Natrarchaeobius chitinivorans]|uniref:ABC transporter permease n=1 Tax=Natrarchaeobius chitinivorans TaxID=1679083 RepID=A0A3N6MNH0_NATCH|nr:ABC transporter permease [Natrarchaeobius chitinivorans]RQG96016.1 ABC transporter permease [Natrarchaeobius chitinivorans]